MLAGSNGIAVPSLVTKALNVTVEFAVEVKLMIDDSGVMQAPVAGLVWAHRDRGRQGLADDRDRIGGHLGPGSERPLRRY